MPRFDNLPLRSKLLITAAMPMAIVVVMILAAFEIGLAQIQETAVPRQQLVQALNAQSFDYLSEVREYLVEGEASTLDELDAIREQLQGSSRGLAELASGDQVHAAIADTIQAALEDILEAGNAILALRQAANTALEGQNGGAIDLQTFGFGSAPEGTLEALEEAEQDLKAALADELQLASLEIDRAFQRFKRLTFGSGALGLVAAGLIALVIAFRINRPLRVITAASQRFARGDLDSRAALDGDDEIGQLAKAFNEMASEQQGLVKALQDNLETLEETQEQLLQSGKLAAVGELAAGVAHEINNPLSVVLTYTLLIRERHDELPPDIRQQLPKLERRLGLVETAALRCKAIADNLLLFAREDTGAAEPVDPRQMLEGAFDLLVANLRHHRVRLVPELAEDLPTIQGYSDQLQQVVVNLVTNAQQAMTDGGTVTIRASADADSIDRVGVMIQIADDGPGIPAEIRERIFDPFYTTKPAGQGTGLGLSIVYGIVQRHGGTISLECPDAGGTRFTVRLPSAKAFPMAKKVGDTRPQTKGGADWQGSS